MLAEALGTNYIPSDEEVVEIRRIISDPLLQVSKLESEISAADEHAKSLRLQRDELMDRISGYCQLISPARRLPADVLREVFVKCLPEDRNPTMSVGEAPMLLTRVSSHWRSVALTTPRLWTSIHIPVPNSSPVFAGSYDHKTGKRLTPADVTDIRLAAVSQWLQRSGTLPLNISVHEYDGYPPTDLCRKFFKLILEYRARWREISFVGVTASFVQIHDIPASELPILESLSLHLYRTDAAPTLIGPWEEVSLFQAPSIRKVSLASISTELSRLPLTWSQLTDLKIRSDAWSTADVVTLSETILVLQKCPNLVKCDLHLGRDSQQHLHNFPAVSLPCLESLTIYDGVRIPKMFTAFHLPQLTVLDYSAPPRTRGNPRTTATVLVELLRNVGGTLLELSITSGTFTSLDEVINCLEQCPALTSLKIGESALVPSITQNSDGVASFIDGFLECFVRDTGAPVCPRLEVFQCVCEAFFSDEALLDFILRKHDGLGLGISPLKSVEVLFRRQPTISVSEAIAAKGIDAGLNLMLKYPPRSYRTPFSLYEGTPYPTKGDPYRQFW